LKTKITKVIRNIHILNQTVESIQRPIIITDSKISTRKATKFEKKIIKSLHKKIVKLLRKKIVVRKSITKLLKDTQINQDHKEINTRKIMEYKKIVKNISNEIFHLKKTIRHIKE